MTESSNLDIIHQKHKRKKRKSYSSGTGTCFWGSGCDQSKGWILQPRSTCCEETALDVWSLPPLTLLQRCPHSGTPENSKEWWTSSPLFFFQWPRLGSRSFCRNGDFKRIFV